MWTLLEGVKIVRALQLRCRDYGYHLCIGGGVINKGTSEKDLDLYFLPMCAFNSRDNKCDPNGILNLLENLWGPYEPLSKEYDSDDLPKNISKYAAAVKFTQYNFGNTCNRIDVFIF